MDGAGTSFRPVRPEDEPFLLRIYSSTRAEELALTPWNEEQRQAFVLMQFAAQQSHYSSYYPGANHEIILLDGCPIGRSYINRNESEIHVPDLTLLPEHCGYGIGTHLFRKLIGEATATKRPIRICVESFNPSLRLCERLGFTKQEEDGVYLHLEWRSN
jgi:RimJ/RimL family protein N-acetyltransferase